MLTDIHAGIMILCVSMYFPADFTYGIIVWVKFVKGCYQIIMIFMMVYVYFFSCYYASICGCVESR